MNTFPLELEKILLSYIKNTFLKEGRSSTSFNDKDFKYFSKGADLLSTGYTENPDLLPINYFNNPVYRSGYLLYFLPVNFMKVFQILNEIPADDVLGGKVRVLDVGSGPGTAMLGVMEFYRQKLKAKKIKEAMPDFTLLDQSFSVLKDAENLHRLYRDEISKTTKKFESTCSVKHFDLRRGDVGRFLRGMRYHIIIVGNVLNEIDSHEKQVEFIESLIKYQLEPNGKLIIIEPALRDSSRNLQLLRDEIVVHQKIAVVDSPCLHSLNCPLNKGSGRDWCHFYFDWQKPKFIEKVDRLIGNKKDWLQCSYMLLSKREQNFQKKYKSYENTWRVISNRMPSNGKEEMVLCGVKGRVHLTRLNKNASSANQEWRSIRRGDIVWSPITTSQKFEYNLQEVMNKEDEIQILSTF